MAKRISLPDWAKTSTKGQLEFGVKFGGKVVSRISKRALKLRFGKNKR
jgi:hypothetical protein